MHKAANKINHEPTCEYEMLFLYTEWMVDWESFVKVQIDQIWIKFNLFLEAF